MTRVTVGSLNISDSSDAVLLLATDAPRVFALTVKAREGNAGQIYLADDSSAKSAGWELYAGDQQAWTFHPTSVKGTSFYVWGNDSGDDLDYTIVTDD